MATRLLIDLRSDTVTKPSPDMLHAMMTAETGDDVFGEDPTVIALENKAAGIFRKEAGLFCPSGTMTNQIAINVHVKPGDEVICDRTAHIYNFEGGGIARNSLASVRLLSGDRGRFTAVNVQENINPDDDHYPRTSLVAIENTVNKGGGSVWDIREIRRIKELVMRHRLKMHLDGARFFNAVAETREDPKEYGKLFDSVSICLSKGLGAPVGSVLLGDTEFIKEARRARKVFGGGMRQAGYIAAAGLYALENNISRLQDDHKRAHLISSVLSEHSYVEEVLPVMTNIIVFRLASDVRLNDFIQYLKDRDILCLAFGNQMVRMVTHLDFTDEMLERVVAALKKFKIMKSTN